MTFLRRDVVRGSLAAALMLPCAAVARAASAARETDVVVIGAGAAGIAAARQVMAAGRHVLVLEAQARLGGRCHSDTATFATVFDRGARWLYGPDGNPLVRHAREAGLTLMPAPRGQKIRVGRRNARVGEAESFLAALARANRALDAAGRGKTDAPAAAALPADLGEWGEAVRFVLGALRTGRDLDAVSAMDLERMARRMASLACREGVGTLLAKLGEQLPVATSTPATQVNWGGRRMVEVETPEGRITARAAIVTVSTGVLGADDGLRFTPDLPKRQRDAAAALTLGSLDRIALELPGNPLGLPPNDIVIERSTSRRTALLLANVAGSALCTVDVGGSFGHDLAAQGEAAMAAFAVEWLAGLFGNDIKAGVGRTAATRWNAEPHIRGAMSVAGPGGQPARAVLREPLQNLFFAGEACHETLWGTVAGAWDSGEQAAAAALKAIGPAAPVAATKRRSKQRAR